jgi:hypothetical protein
MGNAQPGTWLMVDKEPLENPLQTLQSQSWLLTAQSSLAENFPSHKGHFISAFLENVVKTKANWSTCQSPAEVRLLAF